MTIDTRVDTPRIVVSREATPEPVYPAVPPQAVDAPAPAEPAEPSLARRTRSEPILGSGTRV